MNPGITMVRKLEGPQIEQLCSLYKEEWWTLKRNPKDIARMLEHSDLVLGLLDGHNRLVGFSRVLSDFTYKALILDVIVSQDWRGRGLGIQLIDTLMAAPELARVTDFELYCLPELEPFYRRWGFRSNLGTLRFLRAERKQ